MNIEQIREYCLNKPRVTEDSAFGPDCLLFRFFGKIFAFLDLEKPDIVVLKCQPDYAIELRDQFAGIQGAWHWNKKHWNEIHFNEGIPDSLVYELIDHSFNLVRCCLPQKTLYNFSILPAGWTHKHLQNTDSTMNYLRDIPNDSPGFKLVTADFQTAGRGQHGNSWEAEPEKNLLFSFKFAPHNFAPNRQFLLSEALALATAHALEKYAGNNIRIKWPNDIYYNDQKICGMLLEHCLCGSHITSTLTGVGINVNQREFKSNAPNPVSLYQITGKEIDRAAVLRNLLKFFMKYYNLLLTGQSNRVEREYHSKLYRAEGLHLYRDSTGIFRAQIIKVGTDGCMLLKDEAGILRNYAFKEVAFIIAE